MIAPHFSIDIFKNKFIELKLWNVKGIYYHDDICADWPAGSIVSSHAKFYFATSTHNVKWVISN